MRIIAAIYVTIMLVNLGIWLASGVSVDPFPTPHSYVMWSLYVFSVLALLAYALGLRVLPRGVWQTVFLVYLVYRLVELMTAWVALGGASPALSLNAVSSYLWLVVPPALAMGYLGFMPAASHWRPPHRFRFSLPGMGHRHVQSPSDKVVF